MSNMNTTPSDNKQTKKKVTGILIIALVVLIAIFLNAIVSVLALEGRWYIDMTDEGLFTISDELTSTLDGAQLNVPIDIIFCCSEDYAKNNFTNLEKGEALSYVYSTATQLADRYESVSVVHKDVQENPGFFKDNFLEIERFLQGIDNPVIIAKRSSEGGYGTHFKVYSARAFYGFAQSDSSLYAYTGELVFASAIMALSYNEAPTVYFTVGHGETIASKSDSSVPSELWNMFLACGFNVAELDLSKTDAKIPETTSLIVINEPEFDFAIKETSMLDTYLSGKGSVMFFANPAYGELTNLYGLLKSRTGVTVEDGIITDPTTNLLNDKYSFKGELANNGATSSYLSYLKNPTSAKPFFTNAFSIKIDSEYMSGEGKYQMDFTSYTQPLYMTTGSALVNGEDDNYYVMSVTSMVENKDGVNGALPYSEYSYIVFAPTTGFASDEALNSTTYPNRDILLSLTHVITATQTPTNLDYKIFENYDLVITEVQAKTVTACLVIIVPLIAVVVGAIIIYRRKRK